MNNKKTTQFASLVCLRSEKGFEMFEGKLFLREKPAIGSLKEFVALGANFVCKNEVPYESPGTPVVAEVLTSSGNIRFRLINNSFTKLEESLCTFYLKKLAPGYLVQIRKNPESVKQEDLEPVESEG